MQTQTPEMPLTASSLYPFLLLPNRGRHYVLLIHRNFSTSHSGGHESYWRFLGKWIPIQQVYRIFAAVKLDRIQQKFIGKKTKSIYDLPPWSNKQNSAIIMIRWFVCDVISWRRRGTSTLSVPSTYRNSEQSTSFYSCGHQTFLSHTLACYSLVT